MTFKTILATAGVAAIMATGASASTLSGTYWDAPADSFADIDTAITFALGNTPSATFTSTGIDYGDAGTNWDIGSLSDFLNADAGSIVGVDDPNIQESVFKFEGFVDLTDGDVIDVTSDDGFRLFIDGTTFSFFSGLRGPNNTTSETWNGGSGRFDVVLWYFEGNETQAQLKSNLGDFVAPIPVPAGGLLLLGGLGAVVGLRRKRKV